MAEVSLLVPDANTALRWTLSYREHHTQATDLIEDFAGGRVALLVPYHFPAEVSGGIRRVIAGRSVSHAAGQGLFQDFRLIRIPSFDFSDSLYVTLAQFYQALLITTDGNLLRALERFPFKIPLADYQRARQ